MFVKGNSIDDLYNSANLVCMQVSSWFKFNRLTINYDKSAYILFFPKKADEDHILANDLVVSFDNRSIGRVTNTKFLGIIIDDNLNFKQHINYITGKVNSINSMLFKRTEYLPVSTRRNIYFSLIQSRIKYGIEVYANTSKIALQPLNTANNRVLRTSQNQSRFRHVKQLYVNYNTIPLHLMHEFYLGKLIFRCLNCKPNYNSSNVMLSLFNQNEASHSYSTGLSETNYLYAESDKAFFKSHVFSSCRVWNNIPIIIRNANSVCSFSKLFHAHLLDSW